MKNGTKSIIAISCLASLSVILGAAIHAGSSKTQRLRDRKLECESKDGTYLDDVCLEVGHIRLGGDDSRTSVIIYGAKWCDVCNDAARYLIKRGIRFEERDVSSRSVEDDMRFWLDYANLEHGMIPVIVVNSPGLTAKVFRGFVQNDVEAEIQSRAIWKD